MGMRQEPDRAKIAHFAAMPWCAAIVKNPEYNPVSMPADKPRAATEETFVNETLRTDRTIRSTLTLMRGPISQLPEEIVVLADLGSGVNGWPDVCHGGFVATMLDEVTGVLLDIRKQYMNVARPDMTAYLNVTYQRPVRTPSVVQLKARLAKKVGRKSWIDGTLEDQDGNVCAKAEALYVELRSGL